MTRDEYLAYMAKYNANQLLIRRQKRSIDEKRFKQLSPLTPDYWKSKKVKKIRNATTYREQLSIPEGGPYVPISVANYITGYSVSYIRELYKTSLIDGFKFPKCPVLVSLSDLEAYIDELIKRGEIEGTKLSVGMQRRVDKAKRRKMYKLNKGGNKNE